VEYLVGPQVKVLTGDMCAQWPQLAPSLTIVEIEADVGTEDPQRHHDTNRLTALDRVAEEYRRRIQAVVNDRNMWCG